MPAAVQRRAISPERQRLTLRARSRQTESIESVGFVVASVRPSARWLEIPNRVMVTVAAGPSRTLAAAPGPLRLERAGELAQASLGMVGVVERPRLPELAPHPEALGLGQVSEAVFLLPAAALHRRLLAERLGDRLAQRLRAVDTNEQPPLGGEPSLAEVGEGAPADGRVLGCALPEPERHLRPVGPDRERAQAGVASEDDPVEHEHDDVVGHGASQQLGERLPRAGDDAARDGRLRYRAVDGAGRLEHSAMAAGGEPVEHCLDRALAEQVVGGEVGVGAKCKLAVGDGAGPRSAHLQLPSAEHDLAARREPWRLAVRSGSCLPLGPTSATSSSSRSSFITFNPTPTERASRPSRTEPAKSASAR